MAGDNAPAPVVALGGVTPPSDESEAPIVAGPGLDEPGVTIVQAAAGHVEPAPASQTQASAEEAATPKPDEAKPQDPMAALKAEMEAKIAEAVAKVQSTKDAEVAQAKAEAYRLQQERQAEQAQVRQWQEWAQQQEAQRQAAERERVEQEFKQWWDTATPEQKQAWQAAQQTITQQEEGRRAKAQEMAWIAINNGVPPQVINEALQESQTPESVLYAVKRHLDWQYWQNSVLQENKKVYDAFQRVKAMPPEERAKWLAKASPQQKQAVQQGAQVAQAVGQTTPPAAPAPQPPAVTPGSTGNQPPGNLQAQFNEAYRRRDYSRMADLRRLMGQSSGVDRTLGD